MKRILVCFFAMLMLSACTKNVSDDGYISYLRSNGAPDEEIQKLIEYERHNKYLPKGGYVDVTRRTVADVANDMGISLEEYISEYELPKGLPALVSETEANYTVPVSKMAEICGMDYAELKNMYNFPDSIREDMPWGYAIGEVTVLDVAGSSDAVAKLKKQYELPDAVGDDTLWKEVRETVDAKKQQNREKTPEPADR